MSFGFNEFDFVLLHLTSDLQSTASSKPESSSDSDSESESSELIMFFGLQKFPLIVDLLLLVGCNFSLLLLQLNDANESFEQLLEELFLFSDQGLTECCSCFCWGRGQPSFIMAALRFLFIGIIFICIDFMMQRKIVCRL